MRNPSSRTPRRAVAVALVAAVLLPAIAIAHEQRDVAGYQFVVGFVSEPAIEGIKNGVYLRVTQAATSAGAGPADDHAEDAIDVNEHGALFASPGLVPDESFEYTVPESLVGLTVPVHDHLDHELTGALVVMDDASLPEAVTVEIHADGFHPAEVMVRPGTVVTFLNTDSETHTAISGIFADAGHEHEAAEAAAEPVPVEGLEETLEVEVTHVETGVSRTFDLRAVFGQPGQYTADLIPTASGQYRFRFLGTIGGDAIDETFESGPGTFNDVEGASELQFPIAAAQPRELEAGVRGATADAADAADDAASARTLAIAGVVAGVLGLIAGAGALATGMRRR